MLVVTWRLSLQERQLRLCGFPFGLRCKPAAAASAGGTCRSSRWNEPQGNPGLVTTMPNSVLWQSGAISEWWPSHPWHWSCPHSHRAPSGAAGGSLLARAPSEGTRRPRHPQPSTVTRLAPHPRWGAASPACAS